MFEDRRRKIDWVAVQKFYNQGHSTRECAIQFDCALDSLRKAARRGEFVPRRKVKIPLSEVMIEGSTYPRTHLKRRLLANGILKNECNLCGLGPVWEGKTLVLVLDHINGVNNDSRVVNLRLLCPNCNSQTATFSGRNRRKSIGD